LLKTMALPIVGFYVVSKPNRITLIVIK